MFVALAVLSLVLRRAPTVRMGAAERAPTTVRMCAADSAEMDWREMRARLIASQGFESPTSESGQKKQGFIYESPLIEQGTILLGGTEMEFGFALRQQFFHKCVLLLLQHDAHFTKGIILNRPSALTQDGWRLWCGHGQVAEGGLFVGEEQAMGELEINCLHSLDSPIGRSPLDARHQGHLLHEPRRRKGAGRRGRGAARRFLRVRRLLGLGAGPATDGGGDAGFVVPRLRGQRHPARRAAEAGEAAAAARDRLAARGGRGGRGRGGGRAARHRYMGDADAWHWARGRGAQGGGHARRQDAPRLGQIAPAAEAASTEREPRASCAASRGLSASAIVGKLRASGNAPRACPRHAMVRSCERRSAVNPTGAGCSAIAQEVPGRVQEWGFR